MVLKNTVNERETHQRLFSSRLELAEDSSVSLSLRSLKMVQPDSLRRGGEARAVSRSWEACGAASAVLRRPEECVLRRGEMWRDMATDPPFWQNIQIYTLRKFPNAQEGQNGDPHRDIASSHGLSPGATSSSRGGSSRQGPRRWWARCRLLIRGWRAEGVGEGKTVNRNSVSSKAVTQKWRRNGDLPR